MRPVLLRPPCLRRPSVSALTGSPFQSSLRSTMTSCRCEGVVGLKVFSAIGQILVMLAGSHARRHVDLGALGERHAPFLLVQPPADPPSQPLPLPLNPDPL